ncbi:glycoside hydrolase/deacetylase [Anaeromyces robustus]|uniref:Glycoside hydrolase/deacetylase n=1 Tax=Anaeromyces robustus TaxID=1754192 RepID=A0A1Y1WTS3_9FUNG|nr:glycoside hydrolase/deacetylase [Anaeromyces robustus]|eukprot:ORX76544.1 glycoside hydrolase/deacetylase [Anaeromyces robustus]
MRFVNVITLGFAAANASRIYSCTEKNTMALTFDDGPWQYTTELLDQLKDAGIHATFFINGENYWKDLAKDSKKKAIITRAHDEGHLIASHTWKHEIPEDRELLKQSLKKIDDLIEECTGSRPKYFRAPLGHCGSDCIDFLENTWGYKVIQWDTDTNDWDVKKDANRKVTPESKKERVALVKKFLKEEWSKKKKNYLVLMHDVQEHTVHEIVPWIIKNKPEGYKYVTVAECLGDYSQSGKLAMKEGNTTLTDANATNTTVTNTTVTTQVPLTSQTPIPAANNTSNQLQANTSGAMNISSNFAVIATLLVSTLYMLL